MCVALAFTAACEDTRSTTLEPVGDLGFGTVLAKTATNLPRGFATFPAAIVASATPASDSVIVELRGLDSLTTGTYTVWFGNDSATKWVRATPRVCNGLPSHLAYSYPFAPSAGASG